MSIELPQGSDTVAQQVEREKVSQTPVMDFFKPLYEIEKEEVLKRLNYFDGNKTRAAASLGIAIKTLYNKLHEYGEFEKYAVHSHRKGQAF